MNIRLLDAATAVVEALKEYGVKPVLIGGLAAGMLAQPRVTRDVDVLVIFDTENAEELIEHLVQRGFQPRFGEMAEAARSSRIISVLHIPTNSIVDLLLGCMPFDEELVRRAIVQETAGQSFTIPTPEDLIILKTLAGRPKDLEDIRNVALTYPHMDRARIEQWLRDYGQLMENPEGDSFENPMVHSH
jgi:hypothetical protein